MSEKLVEIAKANSTKAKYIGVVDMDYIDIGFEVKHIPDHYVGFRYYWKRFDGLRFKGFINYSEPSSEIGLWINDITDESEIN